VELVREDLRPAKILTRAAVENAIVTASAIGGSTNAPIHITAIARHAGLELPIDDWQRIGLNIPLLVNCQPAGEYLGESYHRAGGVPAVCRELLRAGKLRGDARHRHRADDGGEFGRAFRRWSGPRWTGG